MSKLSELKGISSFLNKHRSMLNCCYSVEHAAQNFVEAIYKEFPESFALVRIFISIPYSKLPQFNQKFVMNLANKLNITPELSDNTPVLSLLGTCGENPDWNDRRKSNGHVGIPLVSENFIEEVPMLSRLFSDLGLKLNWLKKIEGDLEIDASSDISGIFFVPDAKNSKDSRNRKIIPMQDFVEAYNVCTVFGIGGRYMLIGNSVIAIIFFTKEKLSKNTAELLEPLISCLKTATVGLVRQQKIFS